MGPFGRREQLLAVVGNIQMYLIARAVVESEQTDIWSWLLGFLADDVGTIDVLGFTLMSGQQKGLMNATQNVWHTAQHRC